MVALSEFRPDSATALPWDSALAMLQQRMAHVCGEAGVVCVSDYEASDEGAVSALVERAQSLVLSALDALEVVTVLYGDEDGRGAHEGAGDAPSAGGDASGAIPPPDGESIADAVVLARMGLRSRQRSLQSLGEHATRWERLAAADSALRAVQKSLSAVDRAMADAEKIPVSINFDHRAVERSLDIRRRYVGLYRTVVQAAPPRAEELRARLRLIGNAITQLLGRDVAVHLRTGDRALLMMSCSRLRDWLAQRGDEPQHTAAGQRLWQDIANIATMFLDVSKREELVQHDGRLVRDALRAVPPPGCEWGEPARAALFGRLESMRGRSPSLDALIEQRWTLERTEELRRVLQELERTLGAAETLLEDEAPPSGPRPVLR